ncbi:MAG: YggU family protein, partial [Candidatus Rokubacteria bacterium]|nr:YggU family protein [Candidatus Rokubacteria bacterium]
MAAAPPEAALVRLRVQPRASRDEIVSWQDDTLRVRVSAPPVEGEANVAIRKLLARALGVAPSTVEVVRGERARDKVVRVAGLSLAHVRARLAAVVAVAVVAVAVV